MKPTLISFSYPEKSQEVFFVHSHFSLSISGEFEGSVLLERKVFDEFNVVQEFKTKKEVNGTDFVGNEYRVKVADGTSGTVVVGIKISYRLGVNDV